MSLNDAQQINVSVTMALVDGALSLCERLIKQGDERGCLYAIEDDLSGPQKAQLLACIQEMRGILIELDGRFQLTHRVSTVTREIGGQLTYLWTIIEECASHRLRGYGPVTESLKGELDPRLVQLIALIRTTESILGRQTQVIRVR